MPSTDPRRPRPGRRRQREIAALRRSSTLSWTEAAAQVDREQSARAAGADIARARLTIEPPADGATTSARVSIVIEDPRQPDAITVELPGFDPARVELDNTGGWLEVWAGLQEHGWVPIEPHHVQVFTVARTERGSTHDEWTRIITSAGLPVDERAAEGYILAVHEALNQHGFPTRVRDMPHDGIAGGVRSASIWLELPPDAAGDSTEGLYWNELRGWGFGPLSEPLQGLSRLAPPQQIVAAIAHATGLPAPVADGTCWTPPPGYNADAEPHHPAQAAAYAAYAQFYLDHEASTRDA